jgi:hypothetical protein
MGVRLFGVLRDRFMKLPEALREIVLADLETAADNRMKVMESVNVEK